MAAVICCLCREGLDRRRSLHTAANLSIVSTVSHIVENIFGGSSVGVVLPLEASLCRPCLRSVEKLLKLRKEVAEKEDDIRQKVKRAGLARGLQFLCGKLIDLVNYLYSHCTCMVQETLLGLLRVLHQPENADVHTQRILHQCQRGESVPLGLQSVELAREVIWHQLRREE